MRRSGVDGYRFHKRVCLLLAVALLQIGGLCETQGGKNLGIGSAKLLSASPTYYVDTSENLNVVFRVDTLSTLQAVDIDLSWDPAMLSFVSLTPNPDFDDDGQFFGSYTVDAVSGTITDIRDSLHSASSFPGSSEVMTLVLRAEAPGTSQIIATGRAADSDGRQSGEMTGIASVVAAP